MSDNDLPRMLDGSAPVEEVGDPVLPEKDTISPSPSQQTASDKFSALPSPSPLPPRMRTPLANYRRPLEASPSLPQSVESNTKIQEPTPFHSFVNVSESSLNKEMPRQRVSFESDAASLHTAAHPRQATGRNSNRGSDPMTPILNFRAIASEQPGKEESDTPLSRSPNYRPVSPLRIFQHLGHFARGNSVEEPFVPIDPFKPQFQFQFRFPCLSFRPQTEPSTHTGTQVSHLDLYDKDFICCLPNPVLQSCPPPSNLASIRTFVTDTLPRQVYLHLLLRLPSLYFSRVARIFSDAEVSKPDIQRMIDAVSEAISEDSGIGALGSAPHIPGILPYPEDWSPPVVSPALARFKQSWEVFIESLLREWKTLNVVSALLLSAILTMFQIPTAADDSVTRTTLLLSLICALASLSYGCIYIVRFATMNSMYKASRWAEEARKTNTLIWWNVWVLLAMPAVWLAWSMIYFIISILSFVWRTGASNDPPSPAPLSPGGALATRIVITVVFVVALIYFALIVMTLRRYAGKSIHPKIGDHLGITREGDITGGNPGASFSIQSLDRGKDIGDREKLTEKSKPFERRGLERRRERKTDTDGAIEQDIPQSPRLLELATFGPNESGTIGVAVEGKDGAEV